MPPFVQRKANSKQAEWSSGVITVKLADFGMENQNAFTALCVERENMLLRGECDPQAWRDLADRLQKAKGGKPSAVAAACIRQAEIYERNMPC